MSEKNSVENREHIIKEFDSVLLLAQNLRRKILGRSVVNKELLHRMECISRKLKKGPKAFSQVLDLVEPELHALHTALEAKRTVAMHRMTLKSGHVKQVTRALQQTTKARRKLEKASLSDIRSIEPQEIPPPVRRSLRKRQGQTIRPPYFGEFPTELKEFRIGFLLNLNDPVKGLELLRLVAKLPLQATVFITTQDRNLIPAFSQEVQTLSTVAPNLKVRLRFSQKNLGAYTWQDGDTKKVRQLDLVCQLHDTSPRGFVNRNVLCHTWHSLIGSLATVGEIVKAFEAQENLALAVPVDIVGDKKDLIECHFPAITEALRPLNLITEDPVGPGVWATQSMFWGRVSHLPLLHADLSAWDLSDSNFLNQALATSAIHAHYEVSAIRPWVAFDSTHFITPEVDAAAVFNALKKAPKETQTVLPEGLKIAVVRAVTGGYELMMPQYRYADAIDYWLVTDNLDTPVTGPYAKKLCPYHCQDPRMIARYIKTHLHQLFADYDYVVWIDGRIVFTGEIEAYIAKTMALGYDVGLVDHPRRSNYHEELVENRRLKNAEDKQFDLQESDYAESPDLMHIPLMETNFMVVNLRSPKIKKFYASWWRNLAKYTPRDQISFCCAVRDSKVSFGHILPDSTNVRSAPEFALPQHVLCESLLPTLLESYQRS